MFVCCDSQRWGVASTVDDFVFWECVQCYCHSLWDVNEDVFTTVGGSDEAMTLWPGEVLTHALKHRTWVSTYRSAGKDRKTSQFLQKPQKLTSVTTCCYIVSIRHEGAVQRNVFFLLCDIIQGSGPFDKARKLERRIHVGDEREDKEQFTSTPTRRLIMSQHNGSRDENTNLLTHSINSTVFNLSSVPTTVMIQQPVRFTSIRLFNEKTAVVQIFRSFT